jgi:internalin A
MKLTPEQQAARRIAAWRRNPHKNDQNVNANRYGATTAFLDLSRLGLTQLPESLRKLKDLELLFLFDNRIEELPHWIGELTALRGIGAVNNKIRTLPDEFRMLTKLRALGLSNNILERLPDALRSLNLAELHISGNERLGLPESIARSQNPDEILRYYFESRDEKGRPLLELKLLLVGRGKAGKTTLVKQLAGELPDKNESETHSISIRELTFNCPRGDVRARAWDFGGQEILHSTHQFFLTERSLYLLVLEPRTGLAQRDAEYWLKLIETQGGASPVIVVMNWSTGRGWNVDEIKLRRKFPFVVDFLQTDALRGEGIQELRTKIHQVVEEQMPDVWLPFPVRWREIKDAVATVFGVKQKLAPPGFSKECYHGP